MSDLSFPRFSFLLVAVAFPAVSALAHPAAPPGAAAPTHFMSTVQVAIQEPNPELLRRSQKLVMVQMRDAFQNAPELSGRQFEIRTSGNEVVLSLVTRDDMREPMHRAVGAMIAYLNGKVRAHGRSEFYRAPFGDSHQGYLEAVLDDSRSKIRAISAQSVPLRDLLKEIKSRVGSLSYLVPGDCAASLVDWEYGGTIANPQPALSIGAAFKQLAQAVGLDYEERKGTHIFRGDCAERQRVRKDALPAETTPVRFFPAHAPTQNTQVYLPLMPIGD